MHLTIFSLNFSLEVLFILKMVLITTKTLMKKIYRASIYDIVHRSLGIVITDITPDVNALIERILLLN